jgi:hypothetical protein
MKNKNFSTLGNFILLFWEKFKGDKYFKFASLLLIGGFSLFGFGLIHITNGEYSLVLFEESSIYEQIIGLILIAISLIIVYSRMSKEKLKRHFLFYVSDKGFNTEDKIPEAAVLKEHRYGLLPYEKNIDTYTKEEVLKAYIISKDNIDNRTHNKSIDTTYIAGLGSFPHLYLCGTFFGSAYASKIEIVDYNRDAKIWELAKPLGIKSNYIIPNSEQTVKQRVKELMDNSCDDIGIAVANTFPIDKTSIPDYIKDYMIYLEPNHGRGKDCCNNKQTQVALLTQLNDIIAELSNKKKKIHLFVSARASFCINFGTYYMPRTYSTLILHNYDNKTQERNWSITLNNNGELS